MNAAQVKQLAKEWVEANVDEWPGIRAAHLVGGITSTPDDAPFPAYKDVDMHLIFDEGSPALVPAGPFAHLIETEYKGLLLEAGLKPVSEYRSAEAVLSNPEIADHMRVDSLLSDPEGLLAALQEPVRQEFSRRKWVLARARFEVEGLNNTLGMAPMAEQMFGASGLLNLIGYTSTYVTSLLSVATLRPPTTGSRLSLRLRDILREYSRPDLYEEWLSILGAQEMSPARVEGFLAEGADAFDLAAAVKRSPHPFGHKINKHLKPYFVESCRSLLAEGYHREALFWLEPFYVSSVGIIMMDGPDDRKAEYRARVEHFLDELGMSTPEARADRLQRAERVYAEVKALANDIIAKNPAITD